MLLQERSTFKDTCLTDRQRENCFLTEVESKFLLDFRTDMPSIWTLNFSGDRHGLHRQTYRNMPDLRTWQEKNQAGPTMFSAYRSESPVKICSLLRSGNNFLFVGPFYVWDELYFFKGSYSIRIMQWSREVIHRKCLFKEINMLLQER
jgi:hypothetical protein